MQDTFFTGLLSGRIQTSRDEQGAIFIDRFSAFFLSILMFRTFKLVKSSSVLCMTGASSGGRAVTICKSG